jgi:hypothetical protein
MKRILAAATIAATSLSCESEPPTPPPTRESVVPEAPVALSPGPSAPAGLLLRAGTDDLNAMFYTVIPFTTTAPGVITAIVDWSTVRNDFNLRLHVAKNGTPSVSVSGLSKPERLASAVTPAGDYELHVLNMGPDRDTFSYQIFLAAASGHGPQRSAAP